LGLYFFYFLFLCLVQQKMIVNKNYIFFCHFLNFNFSYIFPCTFVRIRHRWPLKFVGSPNLSLKVPKFRDLGALAEFRPPLPDSGNCAIFPWYSTEFGHRPDSGETGQPVVSEFSQCYWILITIGGISLPVVFHYQWFFSYELNTKKYFKKIIFGDHIFRRKTF
jgi:hypothetical protein